MRPPVAGRAMHENLRGSQSFDKCEKARDK